MGVCTKPHGILCTSSACGQPCEIWCIVPTAASSVGPFPPTATLAEGSALFQLSQLCLWGSLPLSHHGQSSAQDCIQLLGMTFWNVDCLKWHMMMNVHFLFILSINCFPQVGNLKVHLSWRFLYFKLQKDTDQINKAPVNTVFLHAKALWEFSNRFSEVSWQRAEHISSQSARGVSQFHLVQITLKHKLYSQPGSLFPKGLYFSDSALWSFVFSLSEDSILGWVIRVFCWRGSPQPAQGRLSNENVFLKFMVKANLKNMRYIYKLILTVTLTARYSSQSDHIALPN